MVSSGCICMFPFFVRPLLVDTCCGLVTISELVEEVSLCGVLLDGGTNASHHAPNSGSATPDVPRDLIGACAVLGMKHQRQNQEPVAERHMGAMKQRAHRDREGPCAAMALPPGVSPVTTRMSPHVRAPAVRTRGEPLPANSLQILQSLFLGPQCAEYLQKCHGLPQFAGKSMNPLDSCQVQKRTRQPVVFRCIFPRPYLTKLASRSPPCPGALPMPEFIRP